MTENQGNFDFIIAGGGAAGLSLAHHLIDSPLRERSILIVERNLQEHNNRTWGFWTNRPTLFDRIVFRTWDRLRVTCPEFSRTYELGDYRYHMIRSLDLRRFSLQELPARGNVAFLQGRVEAIHDQGDRVQVIVDGQAISGRWAFDSRFRPVDVTAQATPCHTLWMHFTGWEIETDAAAFDPQTPTFMDFRAPQRAGLGFFYLLPLEVRQALAVYTLIGGARPGASAGEAALTAYLESTLGVGTHKILRKESGALPLTDRPFPRRLGKRVMAIGLKGGRLKPTTGYAFLRIQHDSAAIVRSLLQAGRPFDIPPDSPRYRWYDALLLEALEKHGAGVLPVFSALFKGNPIQRVLRFLDEAGSPWENLLLIASLPPGQFLQALLSSRSSARRSFNAQSIRARIDKRRAQDQERAHHLPTRKPGLSR